MDRTGADFALERLEGRRLPQLPSFTVVPFERTRGITVRPWVGKERARVADKGSMLVVFPDSSDNVSAKVPLVSANLDQSGVFSLPTLGSGDYRLKLFSSNALPQPVAATLIAGVPADVSFASGPAVLGHVVRISGGLPSDIVRVEVSEDVSVQEALKSDDLIDKIRLASADETGDFRIVVGAAGKYRLQVRWGAATAERAFEIGKDLEDVRLNDILLDLSGGSRRGVVAAQCPDADVAVIPVPDLTKPFASGAGSLRHAKLDASRSFVVTGLSPGQYSVLVSCHGEFLPVEPDLVTLPDHGDVIVEFRPRTAK